MSNETKWTKGPLVVEEPFGFELTIVEAGKNPTEWRFIASVSIEDPDIPLGEARANAQLFATAPKLYDALESAVNALINEGRRGGLVMEQAKAAMAKARGET